MCDGCKGEQKSPQALFCVDVDAETMSLRFFEITRAEQLLFLSFIFVNNLQQS